MAHYAGSPARTSAIIRGRPGPRPTLRSIACLGSWRRSSDNPVIPGAARTAIQGRLPGQRKRVHPPGKPTLASARRNPANLEDCPTPAHRLRRIMAGHRVRAGIEQSSRAPETRGGVTSVGLILDCDRWRRRQAPLCKPSLLDLRVHLGQAPDELEFRGGAWQLRRESRFARGVRGGLTLFTGRCSVDPVQPAGIRRSGPQHGRRRH